MQWDRQSLRYRNGVIDEPGGGRPHGSGRIVLLVHGYNNDKADADRSYAALLANVTADVGAAAENTPNPGNVVPARELAPIL